MNDAYLAHHGVKGQRWGIRRYQNEDGSLNEAGKRRYGMGGHKYANGFNMRRDLRKIKRASRDEFRSAFSGDAKISRRNAGVLGPIGMAARGASKFSVQGTKDALNLHKNAVLAKDKYMKETYGDKYKQYKKKKIARAASAAALATIIGGAAIAGSVSNHNKKMQTDPEYARKYNAKKQYKKTSDTVDHVKKHGTYVGYRGK